VKPIEPVALVRLVLSLSLSVRWLAADNADSCVAVRLPLDKLKLGALELGVCVSVKSTSVKLSVPAVLSVWLLPVLFGSSLNVCGPVLSTASTGVSLVPVTVIVTGRVELAALVSVTVTL
jgi:hypothetical protein